ncbi:MAG: caspase family protein [Dehalococcoidia bacterium]
MNGRRAALIVGIDDYAAFPPLQGCVNDADAVHALLSRNEDQSLSFEGRLLTSRRTADVSAGALREALEGLFTNKDVDTALFYFAGHGVLLGVNQGHLCTADGNNGLPGIPLNQVLGLANASPAPNKFILLDCCHAGSIRDLVVAGGNAPLNEGVAILAACRDDQYAQEMGGRGLFTSLLCDALDGGAADVRGRVTIGSVYAHVDEMLSVWQQRPFFLASVPRFIALRTATRAISDDHLRRLPALFPDPMAEFALDRSYEYTEPSAIKGNVEVFRILQQMRAARLVVPVGAEHMYDAAIQSRGCRLTPLGQFYWRQARDNLI